MSGVAKTFDALLELKDAGLLAASAACQVDSSAQILDIGEGAVEGDIIIDVSACEVDSDDELYIIGAQISSEAAFGSDIYEVTALKLGSAGTAGGDVLAGDTDMGTGRYVLRFTNRIANDVKKRYLRLYCTISGTIVSGINFTAYLAKEN